MQQGQPPAQPPPPPRSQDERASDRPHIPAPLQRESGNGLLGLKVRNFGPLVITQNYQGMGGTGSAVWQAAEAMLQMMKLPAYMSMLHGRKVLELGAGTGINSIAAAMSNATVVATDKDPDSLVLVQSNIQANQHLLPSRHHVAVRTLAWGNQENIQAIKDEFGLFDVILGSDLLFEALHGELLVTIYELCAMQGVVILTHSPRDYRREQSLLDSFSAYFTTNEVRLTTIIHTLRTCCVVQSSGHVGCLYHTYAQSEVLLNTNEV
ncbi:hypothetical protein, variant 1 [Aphanomyces astaci]|uniref:Methyltransferase domain-containing protein n=1 Tax=Aphanomyces astaci TaxID=112090 RepID=W4FW97_APHAT|nr:hypothetical protein, variant 1 [Aphanomyces astaci]ETV71206.1 hypothetical protein, variant 1 [Aphanomyces astaci]|eukprot:XP_009839453.1 hypothetical protein, variant 1 [Aphanomyces astaci]